VVDRAEEVPDVGLEDEVAAFDEANPEPLQGVGGRPSGSEPERAGQEVGLENGLEDDLRRLLGHPVHHGGDAQRACRPVGLRNLHPAHCLRAVDACTEAFLEFCEHALDSVVLH